VRLSIYTFVKDGLHFDYHVVAMLRHHLALADEIIVNEGFSSDGTYDAIKDLDPKIKIFRNPWERPNNDSNWYLHFKNAAREKCTGDWCILLDCDEFIPEWQFGPLRETMERTQENMFPASVLNFYGNYKVYHPYPEKLKWPAQKMIFHRNLPDIEVWGDGSNVRRAGQPFGFPEGTPEFCVHHFGMVRTPARLREKWKIQGHLYSKKRRLFTLPSFVFDLLPHIWNDPAILDGAQVYEGPFIQAVRDDPDEFIRDEMWTLEFLRSKPKR
jgi:glycosyltransferase involved in cell wall biosynthesis